MVTDFRSFISAGAQPAIGLARSGRGSCAARRRSSEPNNESSDKTDAARLPSRTINNAKGSQTEGGSDNDVYDPDDSLYSQDSNQRPANLHQTLHRRPQANRTKSSSSPISRSISSLLLVALIFVLHLHLHQAQSGESPFFLLSGKKKRLLA